MTVTFEKLIDRVCKKEARELVKVNGRVVGMLTKYRNTRTDSHPWKVLVGSENMTFVKAYYPEDGGKEAALSHLLQMVAK